MDVTLSRPWAALVGLVAAGALFAGGYWAGISNGAAPPPAAAPAPFPDWFLPIWDAYDRNPAVTPDFDFGSLYSGDVDALPTRSD